MKLIRKPFPMRYIWEDAPFALRDFGILLTGATLGSRGPKGDSLGGGMARQFIEAGCRNLALSVLRWEERAAIRFQQQVSSRSLKVRVYVRDLSVESDVTDLAKEASAQLKSSKQIVLVNNAGITFTQNSHDATWQDYRRITDVNIGAGFFLFQGLLPLMVERRGSMVLNLASVHATSVKVGHALYAFTKAGVEQLTRSLAVEYAGIVRFAALHLGWHLTAEHRRLTRAAGGSIKAAAQGRRKMAIQRLLNPCDAAHEAILAIAYGGNKTGNIIDCSGGEELLLPGEAAYSPSCIQQGQGAQYMVPHILA